MAKLGGSEFSQRFEARSKDKTAHLGALMNQGSPEDHASPMSLGALLHQGGERKHASEKLRKSGSLINNK